MDEVINDKVFGEMKYNYSWEKKEIFKILNKESEIRVVASAHKGQDILELQRNAYIKFNQEFEVYNKQIPEKLLNYYLDNYDFISTYVDIPERLNKDNINEELIIKMIRVNTLYFDRDGRYGYLCDCVWDEEHGILIMLSGDPIKITDQDELI